MGTLECVQDLEENDKDIREDAVKTLLRISSNILKSPKEIKFRSLKLSSNVITTKLIPASGGMECLFAMGFDESPSDPETLILPMENSLDQLQRIHSQIQRLDGGGSGVGVSPPVAAASSAVASQQPASAPTSSSHSQPGASTASAFSTAQPTAPAAFSQQPSSHSLPVTPALLRSELAFRRKLESGLVTVRRYEDVALQRKALSCVPLDRLKEEARELHQSVANEAAASVADTSTTETNAATAAVTLIETSAPEIAFEDCLMLLLIRWFKREFFKWVNQPKCEMCDGKTTNVGGDAPTNQEALWNAGNVELYRCSTCAHVTRFPRYNHPGKLLETRRGRCGEWANCFGLVARACGFEVRYVLDWTDHVWTEYFSHSQNRWVHGDTCEEGHDKPLLYEHGWGKKLTYVIAFAVDGIQDVTWRYTTKQSQVLARRKEIRENVLVATILQMRAGLQASLTSQRKNLLLHRCIRELTEFTGCDERVVTKGELSGRQSGSLSWRLSRGETGAKQLKREADGANLANPNGDVVAEKKKSQTAAANTTPGKTVITPTSREVEQKRFRLKYFPVKDCYERELGDESDDQGAASSSSTSCRAWESLVFENQNIAHKIERDWEMTYLARIPGCGQKMGRISWKIDLKGAGVKSKSVEILASDEVFESGKVLWMLRSGSASRQISPGKSVPLRVDMETDDFIELVAVLSGGEGDNNWQHAQLFRSQLDSKQTVGFDFVIHFQ